MIYGIFAAHWHMNQANPLRIDGARGCQKSLNIIEVPGAFHVYHINSKSSETVIIIIIIHPTATSFLLYLLK